MPHISKRDVGSSPRRKAPAQEELPPLTPSQQLLEAKLRAWRKTEAAKLGQPAFVIFGDKTLQALAREAPRTHDQLLTISGIGPAKAEKFGPQILSLCTD